MKRVFIKTYGCQMNTYDSGRMMDSLKGEGYVETGTPDDADLVLLNTCHIRERAVQKTYTEIGYLNKLKKARELEGAKLTIGVAGCIAQAEGAEIMRRAPAVDLVFGPQSYHRLPDLLKRQALRGKAIETEFPPEDKFSHLPHTDKASIAARGPTAFLTVQEGCDKFCTFCVVPYTRGAEMSRPVSQIIDEAKRLVDAGVREISLLGQNVNAYHGQDVDGPCSLGRLLFRLAEIPGLERLRYTTSHPRDMHDELYAAHRDLRQVMPYVHLPVQSGSNAILKTMNRQHDVDEYKTIVERLRAVRPDLALSSDFIVGFPGESEDDFEATMQLARDVGFAACYSFKYSTRPGTPGAGMTNQVDEAVKIERLASLQALLTAQQHAFMQQLVGTTMPVLLERKGREPGQLVGRSPYLQPVQVNAPLGLIGEIVQVTIESLGRNSLFGTLQANHDRLSEAHHLEAAV